LNSDDTELISTELQRIPFYNYNKFNAIHAEADKLFFKGQDNNTRKIELFAISNQSIELFKLRVQDNLEVDPSYFAHMNGKLYCYGNFEENEYGIISGLCEIDFVHETIRAPLNRYQLPESYSEDAQYLVSDSDHLYFSAETEMHGREIWKSDGTTDGTKLIIDLIGGERSSNPSELTVIDNGLIFFADTEEQGRELCVIRFDQLSSQSEGISNSNLFPNPALPGSRVSFVVKDLSGKQEYEIFNIHGQCVEQGTQEVINNQLIFSAPNRTGVYFLLIKKSPHSILFQVID